MCNINITINPHTSGISMSQKLRSRLLEIFNRLLKYYGPQGWWPASDPLEIILGAILVQGTNWKNAEKAINELKKHGLVDLGSLSDTSKKKLAEIIKPAGFYSVKATRIKNFIEKLFFEFNGDLQALLDLDIKKLREFLLSIGGIGKETADNIILYAADKPVFPVDNYTVRLFSRLGITQTKNYDKLRNLIEKNLPKDIKIYKEFRALIVRHCKTYCKKQPLCSNCPLASICAQKIKKEL